MRRALVKILLCSGLAFGTTQGRAATVSAEITDIHPIVINNRPVTLHPAGFPDVTITPLWRENGNAWSYTLYAVSTRDTEQPDRTSLVDTEDPDNGGQLLDVLRDIPHTGEDAIQTIHFAFARANGKPAFLLFVTTRDTGAHPVPQPSPAHVRIYQLTRGDGEPGTTPFYFALRTTLASPVTTCHADIALSAATKIPFAKWNGHDAPIPTCPW
ncbi:hypothetical protein HKD24_03700 [Gluconobacter sp. LMG 31484]|uniref:Uncharacterized protein n=1 Tax=Gluconobacter vitians TaxID=2728102 RepID=A0ABR9Y307_9PROT|nr:hypothetical protein [Gluconobacter vitians]MBF0858319.1 hypothetical protein [Gluconobacter vitians]